MNTIFRSRVAVDMKCDFFPRLICRPDAEAGAGFNGEKIDVFTKVTFVWSEGKDVCILTGPEVCDEVPGLPHPHGRQSAVACTAGFGGQEGIIAYIEIVNVIFLLIREIIII